MKYLIFCTVVLCLGLSKAKAQDVESPRNTKTLYTGIINISGAEFNFPLFGFVNIAYSNENGLMLGFVNWSAQSMLGAQIGYLNSVKEDVNGGQFGFVNVAGTVHGLQLGFVNYADSISDGLSLGFISISRRNGFQAFELTINSLGGSQFLFHSGLKKCYTSLGIANPTGAPGEFGWLLGVGYIKEIGTRIRLNPELQFIDSFSSNGLFGRLNLGIGYELSESFDFYLSPHLFWYQGGRSDYEPRFNWKQIEVNDESGLLLGLSLSMRYTFKWN